MFQCLVRASKGKHHDLQGSQQIYAWCCFFWLGGKGKSPYRYNYEKKYKNFLKLVYADEFKNAERFIASHTFRRSFASNLAADGVSIDAIAKMIGDSVRTTEHHYSHFIPSSSTINRMTVGGEFKFTPKGEEMAMVA